VNDEILYIDNLSMAEFTICENQEYLKTKLGK